MDIIKNIEKLRKEKGVTQEVIADALGVDNSVISNIEKGKRELKVSELEIIASVLRVNVIDLFTYPKIFIDRDELERPERISVTFEVSPDKKDILLSLVTKSENK